MLGALQVLDRQLTGQEWLAGDAYSIADIASFPWIAGHFWAGMLALPRTLPSALLTDGWCFCSCRLLIRRQRCHACHARAARQWLYDRPLSLAEAPAAHAPSQAWHGSCRSDTMRQLEVKYKHAMPPEPAYPLWHMLAPTISHARQWAEQQLRGNHPPDHGWPVLAQGSVWTAHPICRPG